LGAVGGKAPGTLTFLFTDVEGSTRFWEQAPVAMAEAMARHDALVTAAVEAGGGRLVKARAAGDSAFAVFERAADAVRAALALQRGLTAEPWPDGTAIKLRVAIHTGEAELRDADYFGPPLNRCARIRDAAHGGQTLLSQLTAELVRDALPPDASLRDLGLHRLRDLERAEQVYQLCAPELPLEFPPLRSLDALPTNLPTQLTSFIGREEETREVCKLLQVARLVTVTGAAGVGKTRLALRVAAEVLDDFGDGAWFVELAPLSDPALVGTTAASAVGLRVDTSGGPVAGGSAEERLVEHLRPRASLVVLDNCEHLAAEAARLAERVLGACPGVRILATSREPLGVGAETTWRVPSLSVPGAGERLVAQSLAGYEAVGLFVERAGQVKPGFTITPANAPWVGEVCRRLDGIPLALELAAALTAHLGPREIAERLEDRFRLLTGGSRTALARQQTLRAAVDWSYDLLFAPEQVLLDRLSVFAGSCTLGAAEQICAGGEIKRAEILGLLGSLVRKSVVIADDSAEPTRYRLLEMIRQYGRERLEDRGETTELRQRHFAYFSGLAHEHVVEADHLDPGPPWIIDRLEADQDNLRAALERGLGSEEGLRMAVAISGFWWVRGHHEEGRSWLERGLAATDAPPELRAGALLGLSRASENDPNTALRLCEEALAIYRELGDGRGTARSLRGLWGSSWVNGDYERCRTLASETLALAREENDARLIRGALYDLGFAALQLGDWEGSRRAFAEEVDLAHRAGQEGSAGCIFGLGWAAIAREDLEKARAHLEEALRVAEDAGWHYWVSSCEEALASVSDAHRDLETSRRHAEAAVAASIRSGSTGSLAFSLGHLAQILIEQSRDAAALDRVEERLKALAKQVRIGAAPFYVGVFGVMRAILEGRFEDGERAAGMLVAGLEAAGYHTTLPTLQLLVLAWLGGGIKEGDVTVVQGIIDRIPGAPFWRAALAFVLAELGRQAEAQAQLVALVDASPMVLPWDVNRAAYLTRPVGLGMVAHVCACLENAELAVPIYSALEPYRGCPLVADAALWFGTADHYLGMLAATMWRLGDAAGHFEAALDLEERLGARPSAALTRYEWGRMLLARGDRADRDRAREMVGAALATAREIGMDGLASRAGTLLGDEARGYLRSGRGPRQRPATGWASLTPAEVEVVKLVAEGLSNPLIAERLFVSRRTVTTHLSHIFAKLGLSSRAELSAEAARRGVG